MMGNPVDLLSIIFGDNQFVLAIANKIGLIWRWRRNHLLLCIKLYVREWVRMNGEPHI